MDEGNGGVFAGEKNQKARNMRTGLLDILDSTENDDDPPRLLRYLAFFTGAEKINEFNFLARTIFFGFKLCI